MKGLKTALVLLLLSFIGLEGFSQTSFNINEKENDAIIYPNPLKGGRFIVKSKSIIKKIEVLNVIGKTINLIDNENSDLKEVPVLIGECERGMYFIKITFNDYKSTIRKLLVK